MKSNLSSICLLITSALFNIAHVTAQPSKKGELLLPRYGPSAVTDGKWIYVYGGSPHGGRNGDDFMHQGLHASIEKIDPTTLRSEYFSSGLYRRANHASVRIENRFITCGGRSQVGLSRPKLRSCEYLDLSTGIFRELPPLPEAVRTLGLVEVEGDLYAIGGVMQPPLYSASTHRIRKNSTKWERLADAPQGFSGQTIAIKDKIYVLGGYNHQAMSSVMVFDSKTLQWKEMKDLPYPLSAYSAVTDGRFIYLFGDYVQMDTIHRYDPETGDLYLLDQKMTPRRHTAAVIVDSRAIVIGGNQTSAGKALTTIEAFELADLKFGGQKILQTQINK